MAVWDLGQHYPVDTRAPHNKCTALKCTNGSVRFETQLWIEFKLLVECKFLLVFKHYKEVMDLEDLTLSLKRPSGLLDYCLQRLSCCGSQR